MNKNEVNTNCEMFCQTMKKCKYTVSLCFAFGLIVVSFLASLVLHKQKVVLQLNLHTSSNVEVSADGILH